MRRIAGVLVAVLLLAGCTTPASSLAARPTESASPSPKPTREAATLPPPTVKTESTYTFPPKKVITVTMNGTHAAFTYSSQPGSVQQDNPVDGPKSFTLDWDGVSQLTVFANVSSLTNKDAACTVTYGADVLVEQTQSSQIMADCTVYLPLD